MATEMIACRGCGKEIHKTAETCPHCGAQQRTKRYKSKNAAAVLAIFLGGFGVHRFYLGQWWGIFYLLLFWLGIPGLVAFVEGIVFLFSDQVKWDAKYNEGIPGKGGGAVWIALAAVVGILFFVMFLGIIAAVTIPAYQDYTTRSKVALALSDSGNARQKIEEYVREKRAWPASNAEAGVPDTARHVDMLSIGSGGTLILQLAADTGPASGKTIIFRPRIEGDRIAWSCSEGTLAPKFRPQSCR